MKIGLISHLIRDYNLGCSALAISNIALMDKMFEYNKVKVEYVVILAETKESIDLKEFTNLDGYTKNSYSYRTYPRLKPVLKNPFLIRKITVFDDLDYVIDLCGGDGYTDNYGLIRLLAESLPVYICKRKHTATVFAPQTIGPFHTFPGKIIAKFILNMLDTIFVRDIASMECCKSLGLEKKSKRVIDVAFALPYKENILNNGKFNIGINVSGLLYNGGYNYDNYFKLSFSYRDFIHKLIEMLLSESKIQIHLIPHVIEKGEGVDDDYLICKKIKTQYPNCILPDEFKTASEAKSYISGMDLFTGARMHSTIGAISSGVAVIPIAYSRKFNGLYDTLEYPYFIDAKAEITVDDALKQFSNYLNRIDELKSGVMKAGIIYARDLEQYMNLLAKELRIDSK